MKKILVTMWMSLDGYVSGPKNEMDWVNSLFDQAMGEYEGEIVDRADTLLLGRVTYDSFAGAWPKVPENPDASDGEIQYAKQLNAMKKIVYSKTLDKAEWHNSELKRDIDENEIKQLKEEEGKDILIYGSTSIVHSLTELGLIDEYQILVHPVILGSGKPLFQPLSKKVDLILQETITHMSGVLRLTYTRK